MSSSPSKTPRNPALLVLIPMALVFVVIAGFAAYFLWPTGVRIGTIDLLADAPSLTLDLKPGDKLSFRLDVTVGTTSGYPDSSRSRSNAVHDELEASIVTATLAQAGGSETSTRCRAYDGKATTVSNNEHDVASSGLPLRCSLKANKAGKHTLAVSVTWAPKDVRRARLQVRRERASD